MICENNLANRCNLFDMLSERMHTSTQRPNIALTHESGHPRNFLLAPGSLQFILERSAPQVTTITVISTPRASDAVRSTSQRTPAAGQVGNNLKGVRGDAGGYEERGLGR